MSRANRRQALRTWAPILASGGVGFACLLLWVLADLETHTLSEDVLFATLAGATALAFVVTKVLVGRG